MKFHPVTTVLDQSDDGAYEIRTSELPSRVRYFNGWHVPTDAHIDAGFEKEAVKRACQAHSERSNV